MIFCSVAGNFRVKIFGLRFFLLLVTVVKLLLDPLRAATLAQEVGLEVVVASGGIGLPLSWVIAC